MTLKDRLTDDLKEAMKNKEQVRKSVVTLIRAGIKQCEVDTRQELTDEDIISLISKQLKQRKDALVDFEKANRTDLIEQTNQEIAILENYLPEQLDDVELKEIITKVVEEVGATSMKDMGKVMAKTISLVQGRADGKRINAMVKQILG
ncbi:YqeY-like protein [Filifactor alocis ATCC 35896]|uniref:YqeY-like protein n=1 Tax=Filifactor alocis (strain ATCC 35896 / CCUG 47790 / D40 B5) TaxID=546269 RepID=D6GS21_FILAD|nr:GatB/YqeY domain-containing protein [Filifactor alocis]EFE28462.1 YqeY-like protein [Filifactor alocis ATCC 35896]